MGVCLGVMFDKKFPEADSFSKFTDGKDLVHSMDLLDEICRQKELISFSSFAPDYDSLAEELQDGETIDEKWFKIANGLRTVSRLIEAFEPEKQWSKGLRKRDVECLVECLKRIEGLLKIGKGKKARFSFLYY